MGLSTHSSHVRTHSLIFTPIYMRTKNYIDTHIRAVVALYSRAPRGRRVRESRERWRDGRRQSRRKKRLKDQRGKEAPYLAISTSQRHCHCHLPSGFRSSLSNVRGAFCSDREEENEKTGVKTEYKRSNSPFPLSVSLL